MTTWYTVQVSADGYECLHVSVHESREAALKKLIEVTGVAEDWQEDLKTCGEEDYSRITEVLERQSDWTLEEVQEWAAGDDNRVTCWIWKGA